MPSRLRLDNVFDEAFGGAGLGFVDLAVLLEETGRGLLPGPLMSTSLAAAAISEFGSDEQKQHYLPEMARFEKIGAFGLTEPDVGSGASRGLTTTARGLASYAVTSGESGGRLRESRLTRSTLT